MSVTPLRVSSKFFVCGIPINGDSYRGCPFGCEYCFANNRVISKNQNDEVANISQLEKTMKRIFDEKEINNTNFLDVLIKNKITWHYGTLSDPFQPIERKYNITRRVIELSNIYDTSILFSTKSNQIDNFDVLNPNNHTFQFSISNICDRKDIEPGVPSIESRIKLYRELKDRGFRVGIRIQPFIPGVSGTDIIDAFPDADNFTIEALKLVPQNQEQQKKMLDLIDQPRSNFVQKGLLRLKPDIRTLLYQPLIDRMNDNDISWSIADSDMHTMGKNKCCCGDALVKKSTDFNNTALYKKYRKYGIAQIKQEIGEYGDCEASGLFTSNRTEGCHTVSDFIDARFKRETATVSIRYQHSTGTQQMRITEV